MSELPVLAESVPVRPAATVMLLRDGSDGLEVFMLQRTMTASFARGNYVFPGGRVDDADGAAGLEAWCDDTDDVAASARLGLAHGGVAWLVAAIRECFEEAGMLLARPADATGAIRFDDTDTAARFTAARTELHDGRLTMPELCAAEDLRLLTDQIHFVDHWITPLGERRRFDTRFFVARAPEGQAPLHDNTETIASLWVKPADAIAMWQAGELLMFPPTVVSLQRLAEHDTADTAIQAARATPLPRAVEPRLMVGDAGQLTRVVLPGEPDYDTTPIPTYVIANPR